MHRVSTAWYIDSLVIPDPSASLNMYPMSVVVYNDQKNDKNVYEEVCKRSYQLPAT
jgi:hypothetical protein